jgi:hypothetical protein
MSLPESVRCRAPDAAPTAIDTASAAGEDGAAELKKEATMSNVPEGAQMSDDGQWWWDGSNWQAVEGGGSSGSSSSSSSTGQSGEATKSTVELAFDAQVGDEADLPNVEGVA